MGLTNKTTHSVNFLKIKWLKKEEKEHFFELNQEISELKNFTWKLTKAKASSYEYEWEEKPTMKLMFADDWEFYQLDISYNQISRWLINSLMWYIESQPKTQWRMDLSLSLYINKGWYKSLWLEINWERWEWKYSIPEQKTMIEEIKNKQWKVIQRDYSAFDDKLKWHLSDINNYVDIKDFQEEEKVEKEVVKKEEQKAVKKEVEEKIEATAPKVDSASDEPF